MDLNTAQLWILSDAFDQKEADDAPRNQKKYDDHQKDDDEEEIGDADKRWCKMDQKKKKER